MLFFRRLPFLVYLCVWPFLLFQPHTLSGQVGIGTTTPHASAALHVQSTGSGVLFPSMSTSQRDEIAAPANGLHIFNTDVNSLQVYSADFAEWVSYMPGTGKTVKTLIIAGNTNGYNINAILGNPAEPVLVKVVVNAGVTVGGGTASGTAFATGILPTGSKVTLVNNGSILGGGGNGGAGSSLSGVLICTDDNDEVPGQAGGNAIETRVPLRIENYGIIGAGGGGGGGGGAISNSSTGGGGGGGAGSPGGTPGAGGARTGICSGTMCPSGTPGTTSAGGIGGGCANPGGNGGNVGMGGFAGGGGTAPGGSAGRRVRHYGNTVTYVVTGTTYGIDGP